MGKKNIEKIIVAETPNFYQIVFRNTYKEVRKDKKMELLTEYLYGLLIGCYCSGNKIDYKTAIQNGPPKNYNGTFIGKRLSNKSFNEILDSFKIKDEGFS
jgi:hypothetical protein